jgi:hypothetical protein
MSEPFVGRMTDFRTFPFALTASEIQMLAHDPYTIIRGVPPTTIPYAELTTHLGGEQHLPVYHQPDHSQLIAYIPRCDRTHRERLTQRLTSALPGIAIHLVSVTQYPDTAVSDKAYRWQEEP